MNRLVLILSLILAGAAACAGPGANVAPETRAAALRMFVDGVTPDRVATELRIAPAAARAVIRAELRKLVRRLYATQ